MSYNPEIIHKGDVPWHKAKLPRKWHRCKPQTQGYVSYWDLVQRCACGGIKLNKGKWKDRNTRHETSL